MTGTAGNGMARRAVASGGSPAPRARSPPHGGCAGQARHGFTHFELRLDVYAATVDAIDAPGLRRARTTLAAEALPTVMRKCLRLVDDFAAVFTSR